MLVRIVISRLFWSKLAFFKVDKPLKIKVSDIEIMNQTVVVFSATLIYNKL